MSVCPTGVNNTLYSPDFVPRDKQRLAGWNFSWIEDRSTVVISKLRLLSPSGYPNALETWLRRLKLCVARDEQGFVKVSDKYEFVFCSLTVIRNGMPLVECHEACWILKVSFHSFFQTSHICIRQSKILGLKRKLD